MERIEADHRLLPPGDPPTPCFVVDQAAVLHNLRATVRAAGGAGRFVPHVKTHRAGWLVRFLIGEGVSGFKAATPAEVEMIAEAGAAEVIWAYPSVVPAAIARVAAAAGRFPGVAFAALVDSGHGLDAWLAALDGRAPDNLKLRIDLDSGMGRTGAPMTESSAALVQRVIGSGLFGGWHVYDGHIHDPEVAVRRDAVRALAEQAMAFVDRYHPAGAPRDMVAGGSYTFDLWPRDDGIRVSPGSWVYSSLRHRRDLGHLGWRQAGFVLATALGRHGDTTTLDAGFKAVGSDLPLEIRFDWPAGILAMSEEHAVVGGTAPALGAKVHLTPGHACTTAYLYDQAWVLGLDGEWDRRPQLGTLR